MADAMETKLPIALDNEVTMWRKTLRENSYVVPSDVRAHMSLDGKELDHELVNFSAHAKRNQEKYREAIVDGAEYGNVELVPLFVLPSEREKFNSLSNKTKEQLQIMSNDLIADIKPYNEDLAEHYTWYLESEVVNKKKDVFVNFYQEVQSALEEEISQCTVELP